MRVTSVSTRSLLLLHSVRSSIGGICVRVGPDEEPLERSISLRPPEAVSIRKMSLGCRSLSDLLLLLECPLS